MTSAKVSIQEFLATHAPFNLLSAAALDSWAAPMQLLRYRIGQPVLRQETLPHQISMVMEGKLRLLGYDPFTQSPLTLSVLEVGDLVGWVGLLRGVPCETAIASLETICLTLPAYRFLQLLEQEPAVKQYFHSRSSPAELGDLLSPLIKQRAEGGLNLKALVAAVAPQTQVRYLAPGGCDRTPLEPDLTWFASGGGAVETVPVGSAIDPTDSGPLQIVGNQPARLVGIPSFFLAPQGPGGIAQGANPLGDRQDNAPAFDRDSIPYAPDHPSAPQGLDLSAFQAQASSTENWKNYPHVRGTGSINSTLACFQMVAQHCRMPFRRDVVQRVLSDQEARMGQLSLPLCGAVAELMGLKSQLVKVPITAVPRLQTPALIQWQEGFAVLYETSAKYLVLGVPEVGIIRRTVTEFQATWGESGEVILLEATRNTPQQRFGLQWFWPSLKKYRNVLLEVFIASFFVQLFGLANPLIIQMIIDKVIVQNSPDTLHILGVFLVVVAVFEALLSSLRTYLFVDTTNRIDLALGSEIIDHLLRLPLRYFEKRPVGELSSRVNELENIRQFLTGTALTVVLDAVFSVIYIVVMLIYSWQLTLVALLSIPLFIGLTILVSPIIRRQLRTKAERNARTQSHLVEVLTGIQTVKAQNIELKSRWTWQDRYSRYVSAGFQNVLTSTAAGSASNFLNKLSALLVLWVGAYLVLQGDLTLGQLIAFRIISGYVTGPLLRLAQVWQNFQETALSLERLADILEHPQESTEEERNNIPMPAIQGLVKYEDVSFRFGTQGPLQLININLEFPVGKFVGIVGQSGSGKSTLMKLLPRLYEPNAGRILIDNYDISKVELYSLRRQIGIVPQDSLLFEGTVQENITLTNSDATSDAVIEAAQIACAHDFIMNLPMAYNGQVGERGAALSGGQRQRIAIARTVLQNPQLLILDEATSALDYDTERQLCLNLMTAFRGKTVFFITHRLSTIRNADLILVMDKGAVVEQGTHEELMTLKGRYYCLYCQQDALA
jgi:HlyB family type I secretion system ABC transporter